MEEKSRILIVEDEFITAMDMEKNLQKNGYNVVAICGSGEEAIQLGIELNPDLILMDICLNGEMKGTDAAQILMKKKRIPIIFITAFCDKKTLESAKQAQPYNYITKPFDMRDLNIAVEIALFKFRMELFAENESNEIKNSFMANMSHEMRTPLNGIIGFTELLLSKKMGSLSNIQYEYLIDIMSCSKHLLDLINNIFDLTKIESGKIEFFPEIIDLNFLLNEIKNSCRALIENKKIKLNIKIDKKLTQLMIDPVKLRQILFNYLSNAIKFSFDGGKIDLIATLENEKYFRIEVKDEGIGIHEENINCLFMPFKQLDASASKNYQGSGLGLALTKRIVEAQGGKIGVKSIFGKGSAFFAILPLVSNIQSAKLENTV